MLLPVLPVMLVAVVSLGLGGYSAWSALALELGAGGLTLGLLVRELLAAPAREGRREPGEPLEFDPRFRPLSLAGVRWPRTGLEIPLAMLTLWIGLSLAPLPAAALRFLSPEGHAIRVATAALTGGDSSGSLSLTPLLTRRGLWIWLACLMLFYASAQVSRTASGARALGGALFWLGVGFGAWGVGQWLLGLSELTGLHPSTAGLRASGPFYNRNHFAAFTTMLFLVSLGALGRTSRAAASARDGSLRRSRQEARARLVLKGAASVLMALAILFSVSRSGISSAAAGAAAFALLTAGGGRSRRRLWFLALGTAAVALWIGIRPVVERFQLMPREWAAERGRSEVWLDSLPALRDFWLTGAGLGSFEQVFPRYRRFGGTLIYSFAHNDYLQAGIELGVPGLLVLGWLIASAADRAARVRARLVSDPALRRLHAGASAAVVAVALHSATDFSLHLPANAALLAVILGLVAGAGSD